MIAAMAGWLSMHIAALVKLEGSRLADLKGLGLASLSWAAAVSVGLWLTKSSLARDLAQR